MLTFIICLLNETVLHHVSTNTTLEVGLCSSRTRVLFLCQWSLPATQRPLSPPHPHTTPPVSNACINRKWDFMVEQIRGPVHTHLNSEQNTTVQYLHRCYVGFCDLVSSVPLTQPVLWLWPNMKRIWITTGDTREGSAPGAATRLPLLTSCLWSDPTVHWVYAAATNWKPHFQL